jgi:hypothetical protein
MKDSLISILVFYTSPVRPALDSSENVRYFEAQSLTQAFQFLFQNTVDIILCSENATFGLPEVNLGIMPGMGGTQILPRIVGEKVAKRMIMTGLSIDAK